MKIGPLNVDPARIDPAANAASKAVSAKPASSTNLPDRVALSDAGAQIAAGADTPFDAEKVARVRKAIEDKQFQIKHEVIAQKLISEAASLLQNIATASGSPDKS